MASLRAFAQPLRFGMVGAFNTLLDWGVFALGVRAFPSVDAWLIKAASFAVGIGSSYFFNSRWTFREQFAALRASHESTDDIVKVRVFVRFASVSVVCLLLNAATFRVVAESLGLGRLTGLVMATGVTFVFGFWLNRTWTFEARAMK